MYFLEGMGGTEAPEFHLLPTTIQQFKDYAKTTQKRIFKILIVFKYYFNKRENKSIL